MHPAEHSLQKPLARRLMPLAWSLAVAIALIMALTWGVLQVQVTLAGFLNSESVWSKAQKQAVIDLDSYASTGEAGDLAGFRDNYGLLEADRRGRDAIASGDYDKDEITRVFKRGNVMPAAHSRAQCLHGAAHEPVFGGDGQGCVDAGPDPVLGRAGCLPHRGTAVAAHGAPDPGEHPWQRGALSPAV